MLTPKRPLFAAISASGLNWNHGMRPITPSVARRLRCFCVAAADRPYAPSRPAGASSRYPFRQDSPPILEAVTEDQIDTQFDVNFKGVFFAIQKAAPLLPKGGSIVVTTSFLNEVGTPGLSILSATKAAVRSLVRSLGWNLHRAAFAST